MVSSFAHFLGSVPQLWRMAYCLTQPMLVLKPPLPSASQAFRMEVNCLGVMLPLTSTFAARHADMRVQACNAQML